MRTTVLLLMASILLSCNHSEKTLQTFDELNNSLTNANSIIQVNNRRVLLQIDNKLKDPISSEKSTIWTPLADSAQKITETFVNFIEDLKSRIMKEAGQKKEFGNYEKGNTTATAKILFPDTGKELFYKLITYRKQLLNLDTTIKKEFDNTLPIIHSTTMQIDTANDWAINKFRNRSAIEAISYLNKLESDVLISNALVMDFIDRKVSTSFSGYNEYWPLIVQNSTILEPGQTLNITAGIGSYSKASNPIIKIDGSLLPFNFESSVAEYQLKVQKVGRFSKKLSITFLAPDGNPFTFTKQIEYTVKDCSNSKKE